ncbi:hypothetical protein B620_gp55 [Croceibacter phage P2559S]|uniref:hypothetical protein n=1 Tax=Croceibacter phage P2559S TaxID=1176422 RepID=UPI0002688ED2|nr:hypothetical protein B620_gp55 [Croceibacter phage P2559S]AFM54833.1 hypothetical protein P2559S_55 [Croceibacter phage P2559S]
MITLEARHVSTEKQKTQTRITFAVDGEINQLEAIQMDKAQGFLYFNPDKLAQEMLAVMQDNKVGVSTDGKSPSKQLRGALYEYWFAKIKDQDFEEWYAVKMQGIIKMISEKL